MRLRLKVLFFSIAFLILFFCTVYIILVLTGKIILTRQLEHLTGQKVTVAYFDIKPPLNLEIRDLRFEDLGSIESVSIAPSLIRLLLGSVALNKVTIKSPHLKYEKLKAETRKIPVLGSTAQGAKEIVKAAGISPAINVPQILNLGRGQHRLVIFKQVNIKDGKIDFFDHSVGKNGIQLTIKDLNFSLTNLYLPARSVVTKFEVSGAIPWSEAKAEGKIMVSGWMNLRKRELAAAIKINNIDGVYLYPYYSNWVDLEKSRIKQASLNFNCQIRAQNNDLTAPCHLELTDIVRTPLPEGEIENRQERNAGTVLDVFKSMNQGKIILDFTIHTKLNRPQIGFGDIKMVFQEKLAKGPESGKIDAKGVFLLPAYLFNGMVKTTGLLVKSIYDQAVTGGKELIKRVSARGSLNFRR